MKDKTQDVNSLEDLLKAANDFRKWAIDFGNELSKVLADIQTSKKEEDTWEMKCPYEVEDDVYVLSGDGEVIKDYWVCCDYDRNRFKQGNTFLTEEAALLESKRRNLLTRFRAFRNECNGDWKADWSNSDEKWEINYDTEDKEFKAFWSFVTNSFSNFGYFKNKQDAQRAIELFGDEIKELFVEGEG